MNDDISVLLPAYNEELTIGAAIDEALIEGVTPGHVIVGNNNSTDRTAEIAASKGVKVIHISNKGKGNVIREIVKHIETPYAMVVDSDCTYPIRENITRIREKLTHYDAVFTYRIPENDALSPLHKIGNVGLSLLASIVYGVWIRDVVSGMWAFQTKILEKVEFGVGGFIPDVDFVTGALKTKTRITQLSIRYLPRPDGSKSKLNMLHGVIIARRIISRRF
jgi:glycosyltransferase involved in cell wall biosynthesis